jgi:hypothetical protein
VVAGLIYALKPRDFLGNLHLYFKTLVLTGIDEHDEFIHPELWDYPQNGSIRWSSIFDVDLKHGLTAFLGDDAWAFNASTFDMMLEMTIKSMEDGPTKLFSFVVLLSIGNRGAIPVVFHDRIEAIISRVDLELAFQSSSEETAEILVIMAKLAQKQQLKGAMDHVRSLLTQIAPLVNGDENQARIYMSMLEVALVLSSQATDPKGRIERLMEILRAIGESCRGFCNAMIPMLERFCEELSPEMTASVWQLRLHWRITN